MGNFGAMMGAAYSEGSYITILELFRVKFIHRSCEHLSCQSFMHITNFPAYNTAGKKGQAHIFHTLIEIVPNAIQCDIFDKKGEAGLF